MHTPQLNGILNRQPFRPFRIMLTTGESFDIAHPEMMITSEHFVAVGMKSASNELRMHWIDVNHTVYICPLTS